MTKLPEILTPLENFQYSVNLEFDLHDEEKIASFIPTGNALEIIDEVLRSTNPKETDRARLLTGAYGKGKSHLTLALLGMLAGKNKKLFKRIISKANEYDGHISEDIEHFFASKKRFLPVLLNAQSIDLKSTVLQGLSKALVRENLGDLMPSTFFDSAVKKIKDWQKNYPQTFEAFKKKVASVDESIDKLKHYDSSEYALFVEIYPSLTSGSEFNPLLSGDVVSILESIVDALKKNGYHGIYIVYDEFSKFLDGNAEAGSAQNVKLLQDIGERCCRADDSGQIHILLISHKNIENYVGNLPKKIVDDWKGISKRFKPLTIDSSDADIFEMISVVLEKKKDKFREFQTAHKKQFTALKKLIDSSDVENAYKRSAFSDVLKRGGTDFVEKCYPLHPYALLLLPKVAELVAQNERTIFTFLASNEKYAVKHFIRTQKSDFPLIEPDQIYDYFEQQFKNEPPRTSIRNQWTVTVSALAKISENENDLAIKIIKTVSLLYIVNQFDTLPPSLDLLREMYSTYSETTFFAAIEAIRECGLLIELEFYPYVRIREISGNNADALIEAEREKIIPTFNLRSELAKVLSSQYLYPVRYNDNFAITRYFKILFVDCNELKSISDIAEYVNGGDIADGYIFAVVLNEDYEREQAINEINRLGGNRVVYALPKVSDDITRSAIKYTAIKNVKKRESNLTQSALDELDYLLGDLHDKIANYLDTQFFSPEQKKTTYYYQGECKDIWRKKELSELLSVICETVYAATPIIVNENINRENLSAPMRSARKKIVECLLAPSIPANFGFTSSQDINIVRSIFLVPRIIIDLSAPVLNFTEIAPTFADMINQIIVFIERTMNTEHKFSELYDLLRNPNTGISLRLGVIPFYIAAALNRYKKNAVIKRKGKELPLTAMLLEDINENPNDYTLRIENIDENKRAYIGIIENAIPAKYVSSLEREFSSFNYIVSALQKWYLDLSRFDRDTKRYCDGTSFIQNDVFIAKLKRILSAPEINAHEFLFEKLPEMAGTENFDAIARQLQEAVKRIESNSKNVLTMIASKIKRLFGAGQTQSLIVVFEDYYNGLSEKTKNQVFSGNEARLLDVIRQKQIDEVKTVATLINGILGLRLEYLDDSKVDRIELAIKEAKEAIDAFNKESREVAIDTSDSYIITFKGADGDDERIITKTELPSNARTFANEIDDVIDSYQESLSVPQKVQIMLEVIKNLIK